MTIDEYHRLIKIGFFTPDDRIELLDGYLVQKMPQDDPHAVMVSILPDLLAAIVPRDWAIRTQLPVTLVGDNEPEPDAVICPGPKTRYRAGHPTARDIAIVIEVSDKTLRRDRSTKLRIYARNRLPVYWIVNIPSEVVEVYTEPRAGRTPGYRHRTDYRRGESVPIALPGGKARQLSVESLFA